MMIVNIYNLIVISGDETGTWEIDDQEYAGCINLIQDFEIVYIMKLCLMCQNCHWDIDNDRFFIEEVEDDIFVLYNRYDCNKPCLKIVII